MKLTQELHRLKNLEINIINRLNLKLDDIVSDLIERFQNYLSDNLNMKFKPKADVNCLTLWLENPYFEITISKNQKNRNILIKLNMPECFGNGTVFELEPKFIEITKTNSNNLKAEIINLQKNIDELTKNSTSKVALRITKIDCPNRQFPNEFIWDKFKYFDSIQKAMEYAVDDVMANG